jgi:DNA polymerase I-like protein with 3'-5' exonuclease and polymerase domains
MKSIPRFVAIDVETTMNGNEDVGLSHPMHPDNKIVLMGITIHDEGVGFLSNKEDYLKVITTASITKPIFCGHNVSFDLMYLYKTSLDLRYILQQQTIWDTQLAEYILTAQRSKFSSLDELCVKYKQPTKDSKVTEYFKAGMGADKVPMDILEDYLRNDLLVTRAIATEQYKQAMVNGQLKLIQSQMKALQATTEMMFRGIHVDTKALNKYTVEVVNEYVASKLDLEDLVKDHVEDINSPKQWSQFFFGGEKKVKVKEEAGVYKNGKIKYKTVDKIVRIPSSIAYVPDAEKTSKTGQISVDDSVLKDILDNITDGKIKTITKELLKYREVSKQLTTYVQGLSKHLIGNKIHGKLNHTATITGRLSSTNPNLQNISNNPIKKIFTSRWADGKLVEVDFKQLEIVALAHLSRDSRLISDIEGGIDIHSALYKSMFGREPTKEERKPFKSRTFQLVYGAGAKAISKQAGCSLDEAKLFIDTFYDRYPMVKHWQEAFAGIIDLKATHDTDPYGTKTAYRTAIYQTETGRRFYFQEYYNSYEWSKRTYSFSPTEMKNYPVQGLATGDIVPMMLGVIWDKYKDNIDVKMINTIHDSVLFDVDSMAYDEFVTSIKEVLEQTHVYFEHTFGHPLALKLNASVSAGDNWFDMVEIKI